MLIWAPILFVVIAAAVICRDFDKEKIEERLSDIALFGLIALMYLWVIFLWFLVFRPRLSWLQYSPKTEEVKLNEKME